MRYLFWGKIPLLFRHYRVMSFGMTIWLSVHDIC